MNRCVIQFGSYTGIMNAMHFKEEDLEIVHVRGSGPGGQNRNKRMSGVRVRHLPTGIVATATERRSQGQNLAAALERLEDKIRVFYHRDAPRVATKKTKASKERRLTAKKNRSRIKEYRRTGSED